ncbi:unnamed protein product, partial [Staurois parvus]
PIWPIYINGLTGAVQERWTFINGLHIHCLCELPGRARHRDPVPAVSREHRLLYGTSV